MALWLKGAGHIANLWSGDRQFQLAFLMKKTSSGLIVKKLPEEPGKIWRKSESKGKIQPKKKEKEKKES